MRTKLPIAGWMGLAFAAETSLAAAALAVFGANERGTLVALQLTARLSFLLFLPAYAGGAMTRLFGTRFQPAQRHGREFGLAFASAHVAHLGLVGWLCWIGTAPRTGVFVLFGIAAFWTYFLALLSFGRLQRALGPRGWRLAQLFGMNYIAYAFALDFMKLPSSAGGNLKYLAGYVAFAALAIAAPLARLISLHPRFRTIFVAAPREEGALRPLHAGQELP